MSKQIDIIEALKASLAQDRSSENLKAWVQHIIDENISLLDLASILDAEKKVATYFTWLIGGLCMQKPEIVFPAIPYFFSRRSDVSIVGYERSLAKMFALAGIPKEIEGEAANELFNWMLNPKMNVSTKHYTLIALYHLALEYNDLKDELITVVEDQKTNHTATFQKFSEKYLVKIRKIKS